MQSVACEGVPLGLLKIDPIVNVMESRSNEALVCKLRCP